MGGFPQAGVRYDMYPLTQIFDFRKIILTSENLRISHVISHSSLSFPPPPILRAQDLKNYTKYFSGNYFRNNFVSEGKQGEERDTIACVYPPPPPSKSVP